MKNLRITIFMLILVTVIAIGAQAQTAKAINQPQIPADIQSIGAQQVDLTPVVTVNVTADVNVTSAPSDSGGNNTTLLIIVVLFMLILLVGILLGSQRRVHQ